MKLSVIVAVQQPSAAACLESLYAQSTPLEIIVVDGVGQVADAPTIRLIRQIGASLPQLLASGIDAATGDIIAMTEAHVTFPAGWAEAVLSAHEHLSSPVIGGLVLAGESLSAWDWGLYCVDYAAFMPPLIDGETDVLPGNNLSFKRAVLDRAQFQERGFWKTFFCQQLQREGVMLHLSSQIVATYQRRIGVMALIQRRWHHGRCFGGMRPLAPMNRLRLIVLGWALPVLLFVRLLNGIRGKAGAALVIRALPSIIVGLAAWSAGEWWGTVFGTGESCRYV